MDLKRPFVFLFVLFCIQTGWTGAVHALSAAGFIQEGRQELALNTMPGINNAKACFLSALDLEPLNQEANLFYAFTRILALADNDASCTSGPPIENMRELLDGFGFSEEGRNIFNWTSEAPTDYEGNLQLPPSVPAARDVQDFIRTILIEEINGALANLECVQSSFTVMLLPSETGDVAETEVDYGDILLFRSFLYTLKTYLLLFVSYDPGNFNIHDLVSKINQDALNINNDILNACPQLLKLAENGTMRIAEARTALVSGIDNYLAASQFIRKESDDQSNDLILYEYSSDNILKEARLSALCNDIKYSVTTHSPVNFGTREETWELTNESGDTVRMKIIEDLHGIFIEGGYSGYNNCNFLSCGGSVYLSYINEGTIRIWTLSDDRRYSAILEGTVNEENTFINSGTYSCSCPSGNISGSFTAARIDVAEKSARVNAGEFFEDPVSLRDYLPTISEDPYTGETFFSFDSSFPDRTFSGILPDGIPLDIIDSAIVWGANSPLHGTFTLFYLGLTIAPWDIEYMCVQGPDGRIYWQESSPAVIVAGPSSKIMYQGAAPGIVPDGWYTFIVIKKDLNYERRRVHFTANQIPCVDIATALPAENACTATITPVFSWNPVEDDRIEPLYYRIKIENPDGKTIYRSKWSTSASATVSAGVLLPDEVYRWQVQTLDSYEGTSGKNISISSASTFQTGSPDEPLAVYDAGVKSRVEPGGEWTDLFLKLKGSSPLNAFVTVSGPEGFSYTFNQSDITGRRYLHSEPCILPEGRYTFAVIDEHTKQAVSVFTQFVPNRLSLPDRIYTIPHESCIDTVTPVLSWSAVTDETANPLYYRIHVIDFTGRPVYTSPGTIDTSFAIPEGVLTAHNPYKWRLEVADDGSEPLNCAVTQDHSFFVSPAAGAILKGDLNQDGRVTLSDALRALKIMIGFPEAEGSVTLACSDINGDGKIGLAEIIYIFRKVACMIEETSPAASSTPTALPLSF
ncbi:MAG: dockerin type I repeat-containing protein [Syntrophales bacterium]|jgi:hypothetical protein|nr:dockerin type I repeat-containing protein [Syntrophales bacterium]